MIACSSGKQDEASGTDTLVIKKESFAGRINSLAAFASIKCVPVATDDESLIGEITKIVHRDGFIYILDRTSLYRFTEAGTLSGKISRPGQGPEEYAGISDFEIASPEEVWILSRNDKKLNRYGWDGALKQPFKLNIRAAKMLFLSPEKMFLYTGNETDGDNHFQTRIMDLNTGETISEWLEIDSCKAKYLHIGSTNHFSRNAAGKGDYFYNTFDDLIYDLSNDRISPAFKIDLFQKNIPASFFANEYRDVSVFFQSLFAENYAYGTPLFVEGTKNYLVSYFYDGMQHLALVSKETKQSTVDFTSFAEDACLAGYPVVDLAELTIFVYGNELIIPLDPSEIMDYAATHPEAADKIREAIKYVSDDQNPVLLIVTV